MMGMACTPDEPVPTTATRRPAKSTPSCGQCAVCNTGPLKLFRPLNAGVLGEDSGPQAMTMKRAAQDAPVLARATQRSALSSNAAPNSRVFSAMPSRN